MIHGHDCQVGSLDMVLTCRINAELEKKKSPVFWIYMRTISFFDNANANNNCCWKNKEEKKKKKSLQFLGNCVIDDTLNNRRSKTVRIRKYRL